ncbi:cas scaffolding protein family member 4 isoform X2 [Rhinatrema bivittatum]|uniref:cas scaffolding protein family member 4 isoform X2 n=1 Tax=Rhinatrema bivittatum TaxID=194408 RepID=UPI001127CF60|nr:cas scaffolding protein family member 4 isoform X2 [Rhinatrema bivittatum]
MKVNNILAKALYDNKAECSDELTFRRGDILMVLEQSILGSEGWWKCSLLGRQGLAPANRLQLLPSSPSEKFPPSTPYGPLGKSPNIYQVPSTCKTSLPSSAYEEMGGLYQAPSPCSLLFKDIRQVPVSSLAKVFTEQTHVSTKQHVITLPRASRASIPNSATSPQSELYDVPAPRRPESLCTQDGVIPPTARKWSQPFTSSERLQVQQQLYDIPPSPEKPGAHKQMPAPLTNACDVSTNQISRDIAQTDAHDDISLSNESQKFTGHFNTLPSPQKSEWIYDVPVSPEKAGINQVCENTSLNKKVLYDIPPARYGSGLHDDPSSNTEDRCGRTQIYDIPPGQKRLTFSDQPLYDVPTSRDMPLLRQNGSYDVPPIFLVHRVEHRDTKQNIYDIPKGSPPPLPRDPTSSFGTPEDRLSVSSVDSRASVLSTVSTASSESSSISSLEDSTKEVALELDLALERLAQLQHRVASSVASLMIYVSSKWRSEEHLGENIDNIHRAVDSIKESFAEFLDFAEGIKANATHLTDANLQTRINKQLQILSDSFQILQETREALNKCSWSLRILVITKPQSTSDNLDRFVMVARTIPDDIKRFVSIIIANGKLLFKKNKQEDNKKSKMTADYKTVHCLRAPKRTEISTVQRSVTLHNLGESKAKSYLPRRNKMEDCVYVQLQKKDETVKQLTAFLHEDDAKKSEMEEKKTFALKKMQVNPSSQEPIKKKAVLQSQATPAPTPNSQEKSTMKHTLSDHARLYFGALQKAISVFNSSLSSNQPPEIFITQSKLIIMVGQKLIDTLCWDVQGNNVRNEILLSSSQLCGLLKNLALATKTAAVQYPSLAAMQELQGQANALSEKTHQFRAMMEQ